MTFDPEWENFHATKNQIAGRFPEFERLFHIFVQDAGSLLELGCGIGMNLQYFASRNADYRGIDGSESAIKLLLKTYPNMRERIFHGDFSKELPLVPQGYDLICERASVAHNDMESIERCIDLIYGALRPGGLFISSDWFSTWHSEYTRGRKLEIGTRSEYPNGQFVNVGKVHFSDEAELVYLFRKFEGIHMEERVMRRPAPNALVKGVVQFRHISRDFDGQDYRSAVWDLVVRKPK